MEVMRYSLLLASTLTIASAAVPVAAQSSPRSTVLIAGLAFNGASANAIGPGDTTVAQVATERLRSALRESGALVLTDSARAAEALAAGGVSRLQCSVSVQCVREAAQKVGARWAVMGTVSKLSNLIWYLSGQLVDVPSGRLVIDDSFELKGPRDEMVPRGASSFARRVEKAAREDGAAKGEPRIPGVSGGGPAAVRDRR